MTHQTLCVRRVAAALLMATALFSAGGASPALAQPAGLAGTWISPETMQARAGELVLHPDGRMELAPRGFPRATGRYTVIGDQLELRLDSSPDLPSTGVYTLFDDLTPPELFVEFKGGKFQRFYRSIP